MGLMGSLIGGDDKSDRERAVELGGNGFHLEQEARFDEALSRYDESIALDPTNHATYYHRGAVLRKIGRIDDAKASLRDCLVISPGYGPALSELGILLVSEGNPTEGLGMLDKAISTGGEHVCGALENKAACLLKLRRFEEAITCYDTMIEEHPLGPAVLRDKAGVLCRLGRHADAIPLYDRALEMEPGHPGIVRQKADALAKLGRDAEARRCLDSRPDAGGGGQKPRKKRGLLGWRK